MHAGSYPTNAYKPKEDCEIATCRWHLEAQHLPYDTQACGLIFYADLELKVTHMLA